MLFRRRLARHASSLPAVAGICLTTSAAALGLATLGALANAIAHTEFPALALAGIGVFYAASAAWQTFTARASADRVTRSEQLPLDRRDTALLRLPSLPSGPRSVVVGQSRGSGDRSDGCRTREE